MNSIVLFILTSSNEKLLKITYNSALNQKNHNFNYNIIINVNSLNENYYNDVIKEFENIDVEIIKTKSNGKPGMGHNSCIELFKIRKNYDYMILLDGDDFLYPYALNQLNKCFQIEEHIDILMLKSTDKLKYIEDDNYDIFDVNLNNNFVISTKTYVEYKLYPWNKEHINLSNFYKNSLCTPFRLFLLNKNIFNYIEDKLYHEECELFDDYLTFLKFVRLSQINSLKCYIIPGKYIYLYNNININSQTNKSTTNDMVYYEKLKTQFIDVYDFLTIDWDITKLPTLYISHFKENKFIYDIDNHNFTINMNFNIIKLYSDANYIYTKNFGLYILNEIINSYFNNSIKYIEKEDYINCLKYTDFFNIYNFKYSYISFIYLFSIYKIYNNSIPHHYIQIIKKNIKIAKCILDFYNIYELKNYCNMINSIE